MHVLDIVMPGHAVIVVLVSLLFIRVLYNYARLRSIPGPVSAGVIRSLAAACPKVARLWSQLKQIAQWYGKVVRIEPNAVSLSDPETILQMYDKNIRLKNVFGTHTTTAWHSLLSR